MYKKFFYYRLDSTSNELARQAENNASEGTVIVAEHQTDGKGMGKNKWVSDEGGLFFSFLLRPKENLPLLPLITGVTLVETLRKFSDLDFSLKWPNDVLYGIKKIAGILVENRFKGNNPDYIVIGCGINVHQLEFPKMEFYDPVSLKLITGKNYDLNLILDEFLEKFSINYNMYISEGSETVLEKFTPHLAFKNKQVKVQIFGDKIIEGKISGIGVDGALLLEKENGLFETIHSGRILLTEEISI